MKNTLKLLSISFIFTAAALVAEGVIPLKAGAGLAVKVLPAKVETANDQRAMMQHWVEKKVFNKSNNPLTWHSGIVHSAAISPNGRYIVTADIYGARVWDLISGELLTKFAVNNVFTSGVLFSRDGKHILTLKIPGTVCIFDANSGELTLEFKAHKETLSSAIFSSDSKHILTVGYEDSVAQIWDASTGKLCLTLTEPRACGNSTAKVDFAAFSADGKNILTTHNSTVRLWDAATGTQLGEIVNFLDTIASAIYSPDGQYIAIINFKMFGDSTVGIWHIATQQVVALEGYRGSIRSIAYSPDGKYIVLTCGDDETARVLDVSTGKQIAELKCPFMVMKAVYSPDGKNIITADWCNAIVWKLADEKISKQDH